MFIGFRTYSVIPSDTRRHGDSLSHGGGQGIEALIAHSEHEHMTENMDCPRCGQPADERFYGPCSTCRDALRTMFSATKRDVEVADYEPKMNVTPNAVATKE
jgi:hypothetical protein